MKETPLPLYNKLNIYNVNFLFCADGVSHK